MQTIEIEVDEKILSTGEWTSHTPTGTLPRIYRISDNSAKLCLGPITGGIWITQSEAVSLFKTLGKKSQAAPNVGISELTLLRAIAVTQDPSLIKDMK